MDEVAYQRLVRTAEDTIRAMEQTLEEGKVTFKNITSFCTTNFTIAETYTWLRYHASHSAAVKFLDVIEKSALHGELMIK